MANIPQSVITGLALRLCAEQEALKSFIALLETEQQVLLGGNAERLLPLSENKMRAASELGKLAETRKSELRANGATTGAGGAVAWLQNRAESLLPAWHSIQQLAGQAQQLNHTNGVLIQARLRHNQQALAALQNAARNTCGLYGPDGQPHLPVPGRALGSV